MPVSGDGIRPRLRVEENAKWRQTRRQASKQAGQKNTDSSEESLFAEFAGAVDALKDAVGER